MIDARNVGSTNADKNSIKGGKRHRLVNRLHRSGGLRQPIYSRRKRKVEFGGTMAVGPYSTAGVGQIEQNKHIHNCTTDIPTYDIMITKLILQPIILFVTLSNLQLPLLDPMLLITLLQACPLSAHLLSELGNIRSVRL